MNCCRCHDHKFDPLTQHDYYALYGFFSSTRYPRPGIELDKVQRDFVPLVPNEVVEASTLERKQKLAEFDAKIKQLTNQKVTVEKEKSDASKKRIEALNAQIKATRKEREEFEKKPLPFETAYAVVEGKTEVPTGTPFLDQFSRYFPDLRARSVAGGHFLGEECAAYVNECLLAFLTGHL